MCCSLPLHDAVEVQRVLFNCGDVREFVGYSPETHTRTHKPVPTDIYLLQRRLQRGLHISLSTFLALSPYTQAFSWIERTNKNNTTQY